jgi:uncharacterized membrane protein (UPF0127 family)
MKWFVRILGILICVAIAAALMIRYMPATSIAPTADTTTSKIIKLALVGPSGERHLVTSEIADDEASRQKGLMFRTVLDSGKGMLFVFPQEQQMAFWMKNTLIPLDVLFFNHNGSFVSGASMTPCTADPCSTYPSDGPAMFALEIPAGEMHAYGVGQGWRLDGGDETLW